jgi:diguanylate cyclase (GGDEF)-like protein
MEVFDRFRPRNDAVAKTVVFVLTFVAAGVTIVFTMFFPSEQTRVEAGVTVTGCSAVLALAMAMMAGRHPAAWLWAAYPFATIGLIAVLDIASRDASVTAQVFFFFPVLYAGAQLRRFATIAITSAAIVGEAVVTFTLLAPATAAIELAFVGAALCTSAALLLQAGERMDTLIERLERQAAVDPLTGLLTRRVLDSAVTSALSGAGSDGGTALLLMDVDRFKAVNDAHGHPAGDAVLRQLAGVLLGVSRRGDVVSRLGGDEIAVLLPGCSLDTALRRAEQIVRSVRAHRFDISGQTMASDRDASTVLHVTLSIGVAHLPTHAEDLRALYVAADASLYDAKKGGRDRIGAPRATSSTLAPV